MKMLLYVIAGILLIATLTTIVAQTGGAQRLLGEKGQRISVGAGLELINNTLSVVFPSAQNDEIVGTPLTQDGANPQQWNFPAGSGSPQAASLKLHLNGVRLNQGVDYNFGGTGGSFNVVFAADVITQSDDTVLVDFR